jgi:hypothetical protein
MLTMPSPAKLAGSSENVWLQHFGRGRLPRKFFGEKLLDVRKPLLSIPLAVGEPGSDILVAYMTVFLCSILLGRIFQFAMRAIAKAVGARISRSLIHFPCVLPTAAIREPAIPTFETGVKHNR